MRPDLISRVAEAHAAIVWGLLESRAVLVLARDLVLEDPVPSIVRLAALEESDGPEALRAGIDDVTRELEIPSDALSVARALVAAAARAIERFEVGIEPAMESLARAYEEGLDDRALADLYSLREDYALIADGTLAGDRDAALERYREALFEHAAAR